LHFEPLGYISNTEEDIDKQKRPCRCRTFYISDSFEIFCGEKNCHRLGYSKTPRLTSKYFFDTKTTKRGQQLSASEIVVDAGVRWFRLTTAAIAASCSGVVTRFLPGMARVFKPSKPETLNRLTHLRIVLSDISTSGLLAISSIGMLATVWHATTYPLSASLV